MYNNIYTALWSKIKKNTNDINNIYNEMETKDNIFGHQLIAVICRKELIGYLQKYAQNILKKKILYL